MKNALKNNIELFAEFNYEIARNLYENITDENKCKKIGQLINKRGGFTAMQAMYYIIRDYSPLAESKNTQIRAYSCILNYNWDGIGDWMN